MYFCLITDLVFVLCFIQFHAKNVRKNLFHDRVQVAIVENFCAFALFALFKEPCCPLPTQMTAGAFLAFSHFLLVAGSSFLTQPFWFIYLSIRVFFSYFYLGF
jgi:hypothetical protein